MNNISFNPGVLYVSSPNGELHPIGECKEIELGEVMDNEDVTDDAGVAIHNVLTSSETTLSFTLTQEQVNAFMETLLNIRELVLDLVQVAGYSRIAYLAQHARKHRTRKKNFHRAYQILTREE